MSHPPPDRRSWATTAAVVLGALVLLAFGGYLVLFDQGSGASRAEHEHGFEVPSEASDLRTNGNGSVPLWEWIGLDRAATTTFEIPSDSIDSFLDGLGELRPGSRQIILGIDQADTEWASKEALESAYVIVEPLGTGDFTSIYTFRADSSSVGVLLHTDWN